MKTCSGKVEFETWSAAMRVFKKTKRRHEVKMSVYKCYECGLFHIGTSIRRNTKLHSHKYLRKDDKSLMTM